MPEKEGQKGQTEEGVLASHPTEELLARLRGISWVGERSSSRLAVLGPFNLRVRTSGRFYPEGRMGGYLGDEGAHQAINTVKEKALQDGVFIEGTTFAVDKDLMLRTTHTKDSEGSVILVVALKGPLERK